MAEVKTQNHQTQYPVIQKLGVRDETKTIDKFRNYVDSERQETVTKTYRLNHVYQNYDFVQQCKKQHLQFKKAKMTIWDAMENS